MSYILITPVKDEAKNLENLKKTILAQTIKPSLWIIGDGKSKDNSLQIAKEMFKDFEWIYVIKQKTFFEKGYAHKNIAGGLNDCYEYAKKICIEKNIKYSFIARVDATPILSDNYFEILIEEMNKDSRLAFVCGLQYLQLQKTKKKCNSLKGISSTGLNDQGIYSREFLENTKGFPITYSPETVLQVKAMNRNWKIKMTNKTYLVETRLGGSKIGIWRGYELKGKSMYILGYHPFLLIFATLFNCYKFTPKSIAMIVGYISYAMKREKKLDDKEVLEYFGEKRLKQVILDIKKIIRNIGY